jgi:ABC-2 type transport system permease protein
MLMIGFIYPSSSGQQNLPVALVDLSHSPESTGFITQLQAINNNSVKMDFTTVNSIDDARTLINQGKLFGAIIIPETFSTTMSQGKAANVTVLYDNSNPQIGAQILAEASGLIGGVSGMKSAVTVMQLGAKANETVDPQAVLKPYNALPQGTIPGSNYFDFVAPGMLMMMVMMTALTGIPTAISHEKETGTFDGVLSAPINPVSIIIGKTLSQTSRGVLQGVIMLILAVVFFNVHIQGSILLSFFLLFLGVFSFIGLGILFTSLSENQESSTMMMGLLQFPMMFLSGVMFPIQQMPWFMQWISELIPVTYAADAMRKVMILNAGLTDVLPQIAILVVLGVVTMAIAIPVFKRSMTR